MKKYILLFIILSVFIIIAAYFILRDDNSQTQSSTSFMIQGQMYLEDKEYSKALEQYKLAINRDPSNTDAFISASKIYLLKSDYDKALEILKNGLLTVSHPYKLQYKMGEIFLQRKDIENATISLEKAFSSHKKDWQISVALVRAYAHNQDNTSKMKKVLQETEVSGEGFGWRNYYLAVLHAEESTGEAIGYLEEVTGVENEEINERIENFLKILRNIQSDKDEIIQNKTLIAYEIIRAELYPLAIPLLETVIAENDEYYAAYMYLGVCHIKMGNYDKAQKSLEQATQIDQSQVQPWIFLAQVYAKKGNQKEAVDTYEKALDVDRTDETIRYDYAKTLESFGLYQQARLQYQELIKLESASKMKYKIDLSYIDTNHLKEYEEAKSLAREVVEDWEEFTVAEKEIQARALDALGWAFLHLNDTQEALKYINRSIEVDKYFARAYYHKGVINVQMENFTDAQANLQRAIDLDLEGEVSVLAQNKLDNLTQNEQDEAK